jgi:hypothetical protein
MNKLEFKEGQTYICTKAHESWWTEGKKYKVGLSVFNEPFLADDDDDRWLSNDLSVYDSTFKLEEEQPKVTMEGVKSNTVEPMYTPCDINKIIIKAYQMYDNDAQRLAFIKGYFAK